MISILVAKIVKKDDFYKYIIFFLNKNNAIF